MIPENRTRPLAGLFFLGESSKQELPSGQIRHKLGGMRQKNWAFRECVDRIRVLGKNLED